MWFLISKKKHNKIVECLKNNACQDRMSLQRQLKRQEAKYEEEIREKIEPMVKKFINLQFMRSELQFEKYQLVIQMDTCWVERCLIHGNSQKEIDYICEIIGRQVYYELKPILITRNFIRG